MTHLHIPDGVLPVWLWLSGLLLMAAALALCIFLLRTMDRRRQVPLLGALSAVMLVSMSLEIVPIAYHINLSVVAGILLGPPLGFLAAFLANLVLSLMGHGGVTVLGLNTLLLGAEAMLGHGLFHLLGRRVPVFWRAAAATVLTLLATTLLLVGLVAVSRADIGLFTHEHGHPGAAEPALGAFAATVLALGAAGWLLEAAITGWVVRFISKVKPDLLDHRLHAAPAAAEPGGRP